MLEAIPTNIFSTNFRLQQENQLLGEPGCSVLIGGGSWSGF